MQDRFKRRYYDKETEVIYTAKPITNTCENGKDITFYGIFVSGLGQVSEYDLDNIYSDRFIRMDCTGLKDKNGKLIFEGDIFTVLHCGEKKAVVFWDDEQARFKVKNAAHNLFETIRSDYIEVIGNIYENPELLKEV